MEAVTKLYGLTQIKLKSINHVLVKVKPKRGWPTSTDAKAYRQGLRYGFMYNPTSSKEQVAYNPIDSSIYNSTNSEAFMAGVDEGKEWLVQMARRSNVEMPIVYKLNDLVTTAHNLSTVVGRVINVVDCRPDSTGSTQRVHVHWNNSFGAEKTYPARQLMPAYDHMIVRRAQNYIESHAYNLDGIGDASAAANVAADAFRFADELTRKHTAFNSFDAMINCSSDYTYRPTLRGDTDVELIALAILFDYTQARRGVNVTAFTGHGTRRTILLGAEHEEYCETSDMATAEAAYNREYPNSIHRRIKLSIVGSNVINDEGTKVGWVEYR